MKVTCKLCGEEFEYPKEVSCKTQLSNHLKLVHNMTKEEYLIQTEFNGEQPLCPCGCGRPLHLQKGWVWNKYASDSCYGRLVKSESGKIKDEVINKREFNLKQHFIDNYNKETYVTAFQLFQSKEYPLNKVAELYNIDKRTLKLIWINLDIASREDIDKLIKFYKYEFSHITAGFTDIETNNELIWIYKLLKSFPGKYTIHSALKYYNDKHDEKYHTSDKTLYKNLHKAYGDEIDVLLSYGLHSSEEYSFYNILKFYIPSYGDKIEFGKVFTKDDHQYIYDFCIGKLLIEYDSKQTYHQTQQQLCRDKEKEEFAINNGYSFLRLTKEDILCPETINKIRDLLVIMSPNASHKINDK